MSQEITSIVLRNITSRLIVIISLINQTANKFVSRINDWEEFIFNTDKNDDDCTSDLTDLGKIYKWKKIEKSFGYTLNGNFVLNFY